MAVKVDNVYHPTEGLILAQPRRHFKTSVKPVHWQLRSLISAEKHNFVYFPAGSANRHITRLNTLTGETETVKVLPFEPRCLVARDGWVCCGGETGEFSAVHVDDDDSHNVLDMLLAPGDQHARLSASTDPAEDLPVDHSIEHIISLLGRPRSNRSIVAKSSRFGRERVNCITMWSPPSLAEPFQGAYLEPVAVLANNDKSVHVVSLHDQEGLDQVSYPDCVNRAVISPDGRLLVAVCDDPYLYVHERCAKPGAPTNSVRSARSRAFVWKARNTIHLRSQKKQDRSDNRGSFTACFSNTGRHLAVGTQYGTISIFDASLLAAPQADPLVTCFSSSRPNTDQGAVRDMAFAPGPVDLLAWTEDRGRVGVADLRSCFITRQVLHIDEPGSYDHVTILDRGAIDPRLLNLWGGGRESPLSSLAIGTSPEADHRAPHLAETSTTYADRINQPLGPDETMVLEAIQEHGRRRAQRAAGQADSPASSPRMERGGRSGLGPASPRPRERSASVSRVVNEIMEGIRDQRERLQSQRARAAAADDNAPDRRRSAVPQPPPHTGATRITGALEQLEAPRRLPPLVADDPGGAADGWVGVEVLHNLAIPHSSLMTGPVLPPDNSELRRRDRGAFLMREWDDIPGRRTFTSREQRNPYDTAGLSWSGDGQVLFVGAESGIYEFRVDMFRRKLHPSIDLQ